MEKIYRLIKRIRNLIFWIWRHKEEIIEEIRQKKQEEEYQKNTNKRGLKTYSEI